MSTYFRESPQYQILTKVCPLDPRWCMRTDRRTWRN